MVGLTRSERQNRMAQRIFADAREMGAFSDKNLKRAREHENAMVKRKKALLPIKSIRR